MSQRIGLIYCAYGTKDYVPQSLASWLAIPNVTICAVNVRFTGFEGEDDGTRDLLRRNLEAGHIQHLIDSPDNIPETTARGMALRWLVDQGIDTIVMWDSDEMTDVSSLQRVLAFIESEPYAAWFRFSYANLVFDEQTRLTDPFTPPRAFRVRAPGTSYTVHSFGADNDIWYGGDLTRDIIPPHNFPSMTIPASVFQPRHFSWLADTPERAARSKAKIAYQTARWGNVCSFAWDDSKGGLIFNPALPAPRTIREGD